VGIILKLAWRNAWRNKRRTVLTLLTIVVGCAMILFMNAMAKGGHDEMIDDAIALNTGYLQIHEEGFWDNQTIDYAFEPPRRLSRRLAEHPHITGYTRRVSAGALLSFGDKTQGAFIQGIDPLNEMKVCDLYTRVRPGGRFLAPGDSLHMVLGAVLAENIGAGIDDRIAVISQGFDGSIAADWFTVVGVFGSGNPEYDRSLALIPLEQADATFSMMGYVHALVVRIDDAGNLSKTKHDLMLAVDPDGPPLEAMGWDELMPELVQFIVMDDIGAYLFDMILFLVVAFGVLNTIQMSIFERTREFGVMLAIGTRPHQIVSMVLVESFFISVIGILLGTALGGAISAYFSVNPIDFSAYSDEISVWGINTAIWPAAVTGLNVAVTCALTFLLSMLFSIFPARRAGRLDPIGAIRKL